MLYVNVAHFIVDINFGPIQVNFISLSIGI